MLRLRHTTIEEVEPIASIEAASFLPNEDFITARNDLIPFWRHELTPNQYLDEVQDILVVELQRANKRSIIIAFSEYRQYKPNKSQGERFLLSTLATLPEYRGRGAGTMLVDWGKAESTKRGLPIKVQSLTKAIPFYQKSSFEFDKDEWPDAENNMPWMRFDLPH